MKCNNCGSVLKNSFFRPQNLGSSEEPNVNCCSKPCLNNFLKNVILNLHKKRHALKSNKKPLNDEKLSELAFEFKTDFIILKRYYKQLDKKSQNEFSVRFILECGII